VLCRPISAGSLVELGVHYLDPCWHEVSGRHILDVFEVAFAVEQAWIRVTC